MMVPLMLPEAPPTEFQLRMKPALMAIVALQGTAAFCRILAGDLWGGLSGSMIAIIGGFAVGEMSITYVVYYGVGCALNCVFDTAAASVRCARLKLSFFDLDRPFLFNLLSFGLLSAAVSTLLGAIVSYAIWRDFRQCAGELSPFYGAAAASVGLGPGAGQAGGNQQFGSYGSLGPGPAPRSLSTSGSIDAFSGPGYRLHDNRPGSIDNLPPAPRMSYG
mmetsp:Transcript_18375/g.58326  ORF Transcript_18375/g.58326 Transcript_18375/m.58326 type:complete len:219 (+) Transcript_18375:77-733(+)